MTDTQLIQQTTDQGLELPRLNEFEIAWLIKMPEIYRAVSDYHMIKGVEADAIGCDARVAEYHDKRKDLMDKVAAYIQAAHDEGDPPELSRPAESPVEARAATVEGFAAEYHRLHGKYPSIQEIFAAGQRAASAPVMLTPREQKLVSALNDANTELDAGDRHGLMCLIEKLSSSRIQDRDLEQHIQTLIHRKLELELEHKGA